MSYWLWLCSMSAFCSFHTSNFSIIVTAYNTANDTIQIGMKMYTTHEPFCINLFSIYYPLFVTFVTNINLRCMKYIRCLLYFIILIIGNYIYSWFTRYIYDQYYWASIVVLVGI